MFRNSPRKDKIPAIRQIALTSQLWLKRGERERELQETRGFQDLGEIQEQQGSIQEQQGIQEQQASIQERVEGIVQPH